MIITRSFINRRFYGAVDFDTFFLLAVIPRKGKGTILMLVPKDYIRGKHFNLRFGGNSFWYNSLDDLLDAAGEYCKICRFRRWLYRRRYFKLTGRK